MPPPSDAPSLHLHVLPNPFYLLQLNASEPLPRAVLDRLMGGGDDGDDLFFSVTRTKEEISIVSEVQPGTATATAAAAACWRCIRVAGPMDLGLTGILCDLTTPLKAAGIPIFALSTWDTDYLLVPDERGGEAAAVLQADGWTVKGAY